MLDFRQEFRKVEDKIVCFHTGSPQMKINDWSVRAKQDVPHHYASEK